MDVNDLETPAVVIDEAIVKRNIARYQAYCDANGLALRPHIKTHKQGRYARMQMAAGAAGITCQKVSEAEVMADQGLDDILITYNIVGAAKLVRLRALHERVRALSVVADNAVVVAGLAAAFADAGRPLPVRVECDSGAGRCGVQTPEQAVALAKLIAGSPGLRFGGLMTFPNRGGGAAVAAFMAEAKVLLEQAGLDCPVVSSGGSPDMWIAAEVAGVTEQRIGTYIYNDRSLVAVGTCGWEDCALTVHATVVSTPTPGRAVIDAGSKTLSSDLFGQKGHGHVIGHDDVHIAALSEEHGVLNWAGGTRFAVGDRLRIVPNHCCVVSNLFDTVFIIEESGDVVAQAVDARGKVT